MRPTDLLARPLAAAARLPWWAALLSAAAAYALLHPLARLRLPAAETGAGVAARAFAELLISAAAVAQVLIPLVLLMLAAGSLYAAWRRRDLFSAAASDLAGSVLRGLTREECGLLLAEAFRRLGYRVGEPDTGSARLVVSRNDQDFLVDFGHWRAWQVEGSLVEKLEAAIVRAGAKGGIAVSSGRFASDAQRLARDLGIELADSRRLRELIQAGWDPFAADGRALTLASAPSQEPQPTLPGRSDDKDSGNSAVGEALAALIREEGRAPTVSDGVVRTERTPNAERPGLAESHDASGSQPLAAWGEVARARTRREARAPRRLRPGRMLDAVGMLVAAGLLWSGWQWLAALPSAPEQPSWDRLPLALAQPAELSSAAPRERSSGARPLGEFHFGPAGGTPVSTAPAPTEGEGVLMPQLSVWELEAAFDASYIPPPECANWQSTADMARCGNHRMRTLRAFIESGGKSSPAMRGESLARSTSSAAPTWREEWAQSQERPLDGDAEPAPIPLGRLAVPSRGPEDTPSAAASDPAATPPSALTWREEQALREAGAGARLPERSPPTSPGTDRDPWGWRGDLPER